MGPKKGRKSIGGKKHVTGGRNYVKKALRTSMPNISDTTASASQPRHQSESSPAQPSQKMVQSQKPAPAQSQKSTPTQSQKHALAQSHYTPPVQLSQASPAQPSQTFERVPNTPTQPAVESSPGQSVLGSTRSTRRSTRQSTTPMDVRRTQAQPVQTPPVKKPVTGGRNYIKKAVRERMAREAAEAAAAAAAAEAAASSETNHTGNVQALSQITAHPDSGRRGDSKEAVASAVSRDTRDFMGNDQGPFPNVSSPFIIPNISFPQQRNQSTAEELPCSSNTTDSISHQEKIPAHKPTPLEVHSVSALDVNPDDILAEADHLLEVSISSTKLPDYRDSSTFVGSLSPGTQAESPKPMLDLPVPSIFDAALSNNTAGNSEPLYNSRTDNRPVFSDPFRNSHAPSMSGRPTLTWNAPSHLMTTISRHSPSAAPTRDTTDTSSRLTTPAPTPPVAQVIHSASSSPLSSPEPSMERLAGTDRGSSRGETIKPADFYAQQGNSRSQTQEGGASDTAPHTSGPASPSRSRSTRKKIPTTKDLAAWSTVGEEASAKKARGRGTVQIASPPRQMRARTLSANRSPSNTRTNRTSRNRSLSTQQPVIERSGPSIQEEAEQPPLGTIIVRQPQATRPPTFNPSHNTTGIPKAKMTTTATVVSGSSPAPSGNTQEEKAAKERQMAAEVFKKISMAASRGCGSSKNAIHPPSKANTAPKPPGPPVPARDSTSIPLLRTPAGVVISRGTPAAGTGSSIPRPSAEDVNIRKGAKEQNSETPAPRSRPHVKYVKKARPKPADATSNNPQPSLKRKEPPSSGMPARQQRASAAKAIETIHAVTGALKWMESDSKKQKTSGSSFVQSEREAKRFMPLEVPKQTHSGRASPSSQLLQEASVPDGDETDKNLTQDEAHDLLLMEVDETLVTLRGDEAEQEDIGTPAGTAPTSPTMSDNSTLQEPLTILPTPNPVQVHGPEDEQVVLSRGSEPQRATPSTEATESNEKTIDIALAEPGPLEESAPSEDRMDVDTCAGLQRESTQEVSAGPTASKAPISLEVRPCMEEEMVDENPEPLEKPRQEQASTPTPTETPKSSPKPAACVTNNNSPADDETYEAAERLLGLFNRKYADPPRSPSPVLKCEFCDKTVQEISNYRASINLPKIPNNILFEKHVELCMEYTGADERFDDSENEDSPVDYVSGSTSTVEAQQESSPKQSLPYYIDYSANRDGPFKPLTSLETWTTMLEDPNLTEAETLAIEESLVFSMLAAQAEYQYLNEISAKLPAPPGPRPKKRKGLKGQPPPKRAPFEPEDRVVYEDKKEAALYGFEYDPDPKKRGKQSPQGVKGRGLRIRNRNLEPRIVSGYEAGGESKGMDVKLSRRGQGKTAGTGTPAPTAAPSRVPSGASTPVPPADVPVKRKPGRPRKDGTTTGSQKHPHGGNVISFHFTSKGRESMKGILSRDVSPGSRPGTPGSVAPFTAFATPFTTSATPLTASATPFTAAATPLTANATPLNKPITPATTSTASLTDANGASHLDSAGRGRGRGRGGRGRGSRGGRIIAQPTGRKRGRPSNAELAARAAAAAGAGAGTPTTTAGPPLLAPAPAPTLAPAPAPALAPAPAPTLAPAPVHTPAYIAPGTTSTTPGSGPIEQTAAPAPRRESAGKIKPTFEVATPPTTMEEEFIMVQNTELGKRKRSIQNLGEDDDDDDDDEGGGEEGDGEREAKRWRGGDVVEGV